MARFEKRFSGKDNAGLRKAVRAQVDAFEDGLTTHFAAEESGCLARRIARIAKSRGEAVLALKRTIALTAQGVRTLEEVAKDYDEKS